jgi:phosphate transport system substrate-binding protein
MAELRGRCKNTEYCSNAVSQKIVSIPDGEPLNCPKCGEPLEELKTAQRSQRNRSMLFVQVLVIVVAGGGVAYKLIGSGLLAPAKPGPAPSAAAAPAPELAPLAPQENAAAAPEAAPAPPPAAAPAAPPAAMLLRMAGSDVIGAKLARRLASGYLALIGDTDITMAQGQTADSVAVVGASAGQREGIGITAGSSSSGFATLLRGSADIAMAVRPVSAAETEKLSAVGDMTSAANEHVIAVEGVAAIVSPANRIPSLTVAQLRGILTGQITDWSQLGGTVGPIHVVAQDSNGGARDTAADIVLSGSALTGTAKLLPAEDAVAAGVAADHNAVGLVALANAGTARVVPVGETGAAPVAPSDLAVSTEDYPLTRRLYFYTASGNNNFVRRFSDYVASPAGQAAVEAAGFVPLTVKSAPVAVPATASDRYRELVSGATRVSIDFRFQPGSTELDSRGVRDLDRLVSFLRAQHAGGDRLILAGFADSHGTPSANLFVSQKRADAVVAALSAAGISPGHVATFGDDLPVADNATAEGRERNRRVEVYLKAAP